MSPFAFSAPRRPGRLTRRFLAILAGGGLALSGGLMALRWPAREVAGAGGMPPQSGATPESVRVQAVAEQELRRLDARFRPACAFVIVSEAETGRLLACAASGTAHDAGAHDFIHEPGSVFKAVVWAAALDSGVMSPESPMADSAVARDFHEAVIDWSSPAAVTTATLLESSQGAGTLAAYARRFGFGEQAPGCASRTDALPDLRQARSAYFFPLGHGFVATPMQVHGAIAVFAAGGCRVFPDTTAGRPPRRAISATTATTMAGWMRESFARAAPATDIAGVDGVAQCVVDGAYSDKRFRMTASGFFPASRPRYVVTVVVEDPHAPESESSAWSAARDALVRLADALAGARVRPGSAGN